MPSLGTLTTHLALDNRQLNRGAQQSESRLGRLGASMRTIARRSALMGTALVGVGAAIGTQLVRRGLEAIDTQAKLARSLGGTIDGLRGTQIAAEDAGVSTGAFESAMGNLNRRLGEAIRGQGQAAEAMERLGLEARELASMDVDQRMAAIADRVNELGLSSAETADLMGQLGVRNQEMVDFLREGGGAIRDARDEVDEFGLSLSEVDAASIERANDAMSRLGRVIEVIRDRLTAALAPYIEYVADLINDAARESGGFREQIERAIEIGIRGFARVADVVEGVRRSFQLAGRVGALAIIALEREFWSLTDTLVNGPIRQLNRLIDLYNRIPMLPDIEPLGMTGIGDTAQQNIERAERAIEIGKQDIEEILMKPMPSTSVEKALQDIQDRARETSEEFVRERAKMDDAMLAPPAPEEDDEARERARKEAERHREQLEERIERIREANMEEAELAEKRHEGELEKLREAKELEILTEKEFNELKEEIEQAHMERMKDIRQRGLSDLERFTAASYRKQAQTVASELQNMTASVANENRAMFEVNRVASIGMAMLNMHRGISESLAAYPMPLAAAMAATHAAAGMAQVNAIRSQSYGSGATAPSATPAGSGAAAGSTPTHDAGAGAVRRTEVAIGGFDDEAIFSGKQVRRLIESINDELDGGMILRAGG